MYGKWIKTKTITTYNQRMPYKININKIIVIKWNVQIAT